MKSIYQNDQLQFSLTLEQTVCIYANHSQKSQQMCHQYSQTKLVDNKVKQTHNHQTVFKYLRICILIIKTK